MKRLLAVALLLAGCDGEGFQRGFPLATGGVAGMAGASGVSPGGASGAGASGGVGQDAEPDACIDCDASTGGVSGSSGASGAAGVAGAAGADSGTVDAGPTLPEHPECFYPLKDNGGYFWAVGGVGCLPCDIGYANCDGINANGCEVQMDFADPGTVCAFCPIYKPGDSSCKRKSSGWVGCCDPSNVDCLVTGGTPCDQV